MVEFDPTMVAMYALNRDSCIWCDTSDMDLDGCTRWPMRWSSRIQDAGWPAYASISAPCPPWSHGGLQAGLKDEKGSALVHAWVLMRIFQLLWIAFEQVAGFKTRENYVAVQAIANWAGFELITDITSDLTNKEASLSSSLCRARHCWKQTRRMAAMHQVAWDDPQNLWQLWRDQCPRILAVWACLCDNRNVHGAHIDAGTSSTLRFCSIEFLALIRSRMCSCMRMGNNMNYRYIISPVEGSLGSLSDRQNQTFRFWAPWEVAMLHLQDHDILLPKPQEVSWGRFGKLQSYTTCSTHPRQHLHLGVPATFPSSQTSSRTRCPTDWQYGTPPEAKKTLPGILRERKLQPAELIKQPEPNQSSLANSAYSFHLTHGGTHTAPGPTANPHPDPARWRTSDDTAQPSLPSDNNPSTRGPWRILHSVSPTSPPHASGRYGVRGFFLLNPSAH